MFLEQWLEGTTTRGTSREGDRGTYAIFSLEASRTMALVTTAAIQPLCFQHLDIVVLRSLSGWLLRQDLTYPRPPLSLLCSW